VVWPVPEPAGTQQPLASREHPDRSGALHFTAGLVVVLIFTSSVLWLEASLASTDLNVYGS
jgi:hypothetical protein